jgi:hypothetical protein
MNGWSKLAAFVGVAAILAAVTGGAGAAGTTTHAQASKSRIVAGGPKSAAALRRVTLLRTADLSTRAGAVRYLRAIGLDPRHVVIQRGSKNYAGPKCPGSGWRCTKGRRVLQIGTANLYTCSPGTASPPNSCTIIQHNGTGNGTATCTETSVGPTQTCSITQDSSSGSNTANVTQTLAQARLGSGTQNATQNARVVQSSGAGSNTASVRQVLVQALGRGSDSSDEGDNDADDVTPAVSSPIAQQQDAHQNVYVNQSATGSGANSSTIDQGQLQVERADHAPSISQKQNTTLVDGSAQCPVLDPTKDDLTSNQCNAVQQSSAGGTNDSKVQQSYNQFQAASNCCTTAATRGTQIQGVDGKGGIDHRFTQASSGVSTQSSNQVERQIQRRSQIGTGGIAAEQHGPTRKGTGIQTGSAADKATQNQSSTQTSTPAADVTQTNLVTDVCASTGTCTGTQTVTQQGNTTTQTQTASTISLTTSCAPNCTTQPPIIFDGSPGTAAPPTTLGPYAMTAFGPDPQPVGATVTGVSDSAGMLGFSPALTHRRVGNGWATWSHGYTGDVYSTPSGGPITITLPAGTRAFYLYAEPNIFNVFNVTATAQDGTTSGPVQVQGNSGAQYFGFYATGSPNIATITVTGTDTTGLAVGEFGIAPAASPPIG